MTGDLSQLPNAERWSLLIEMFRPRSAGFAVKLEALRDAGQDLDGLLNDILSAVAEREFVPPLSA